MQVFENALPIPVLCHEAAVQLAPLKGDCAIVAAIISCRQLACGGPLLSPLS
jgi:hypothetical protein